MADIKKTEGMSEEEKSRMRAAVLRWINEKEVNKKTRADKPPVKPRETVSPMPIERRGMSAHKEITEHKKDKKTHTHKHRQAVKRENLNKHAAHEHKIEREAHVMIESQPRKMLSSGNFISRILPWLYRAVWFAAIAALIVLAVGVYRFGWNNASVNKILIYVPLPYGFVNYHPIWIGSIRSESNALNHFYKQQTGTNFTLPSDEEVRLAIIDTVIRRSLAENLAKEYDIWVTQGEIDKELQRLADEAGGLPQVKITINQLWGWQTEDYVAKVLRPYLLKQKLLTALKDDPVISRELGGDNTVGALDNYLDRLRSEANIVLLVK